MHDEYVNRLNSVYRERNHLVALISKIFPSSIEVHQDDPFYPWDPEWRNVIMIDLPTGQVSWHVHDSDMDMFKHLPKFQGRRKWDGYSTEEKYRRVDAMLPTKIYFNPCPECGSFDIRLEHFQMHADQSPNFWCECENGHTASSAVIMTKKEAIDIWNNYSKPIEGN